MKHFALAIVVFTLTACGGGGGSENPSENSQQTLTYTNSLGMSFKLLPSGIFTMGSPTTELGRSNDETQHQVTLTKSFYIQTTEVTQGQWIAVMGASPSAFFSCVDDCPVEMVSFLDIQQFLLALNGLGEGTYKLPTEGQWEYACRAGSIYAFANGEITNETGVDPALMQIGWYTENSGNFTHPVAQKIPNAWGLYDMHGNVYEWTADLYGSYTGDETDPTGAAGGAGYVVRGGGWGRGAKDLRCAMRGGSTSASEINNQTGLRLVRER